VQGPACVPCRAGDSHGIFNNSDKPFRWYAPQQPVVPLSSRLPDSIPSQISVPKNPKLATVRRRFNINCCMPGQSYDAIDLEKEGVNNQPGGEPRLVTQPAQHRFFELKEPFYRAFIP
jgi:hypothetical protein